jgi:DNA replication protein DnaC
MSEFNVLQNQLQQMRLRGFLQALLEQRQTPHHYLDMDFEQRLSFLVQREMDLRQQRRAELLKSQAHLRQSASLEALDFTQPGRLNKQEILRLSTCDFIEKGQNLLIGGPTGVGKTYLACALADCAVRKGIKTRYVRASLLYQELQEARNKDGYRKKLAEYARVQFLLIDDFGLEKLHRQEALDLLEIMDEKTQNGSVALITQISMNIWDTLIDEPALSEAILDRFIHTAVQVYMKGESMRKVLRAI